MFVIKKEINKITYILVFYSIESSQKKNCKVRIIFIASALSHNKKKTENISNYNKAR